MLPSFERNIDHLPAFFGDTMNLNFKNEVEVRMILDSFSGISLIKSKTFLPHWRRSRSNRHERHKELAKIHYNSLLVRSSAIKYVVMKFQNERHLVVTTPRISHMRRADFYSWYWMSDQNVLAYGVKEPFIMNGVKELKGSLSLLSKISIENSYYR